MKLPKSIYNWISISGFILALNSLIIIAILFIFSLFSKENNTYLGLFTYIVVPAFLVLGLLLIPLGMIIKRRKKQTSDETQGKWPILDLNMKFQRSALIKITVITVVLLILSSIGSYQAFHYSESVEFCGTLCHQVMEPEYVTYQHSAHAQVKCVECHVGEGAGWYVKSKLSGLYQVYSVIFKKYSQPIGTPLHNLRPASETCEKCHWPEKFYSQKLRNQRSYLADSANSEWDISLLMKIGPEHSAMGLSEGIHWHINKDFKIEYVASTKDRENIPWVKLTNLKTGEVKIYMDEENPVDQPALDSLEKRSMDCMDCHNRPSHIYKTAPEYIDQAIIAGKIPVDLPYIKYAAMQALKLQYPTKEAGHKAIDSTVLAFYNDEQPDIYSKESERINKALVAIKAEYDNNVFPYMKADATQYLNHIGHLESQGCFRCHSDRHKTSKGETIKKDCELCHSILAQGPSGKMTTVPLTSTMEFMHPVEIRNVWKTAMCSDCHKVLYE
jgi:nitrate/TMAO reductase-like tetraheme cytochrome c subunit